MDKETPIAYAEKGSEQETELRQTAEKNADMEKNYPKYIIAVMLAIFGAIILVLVLHYHCWKQDIKRNLGHFAN